MQGTGRIPAVICSILILIFGIIHLGVSIGILTRFGPYGDVFRPERGLAGFNLVVTIVALLVGGIGLFSVLTDRGQLSTIVAFASIALAFLALVSLITALIINSLAIGYSSSHFLSNMNNYINSQDSRVIVDTIQTRYTCCGGNSWIDWVHVGLNATGSTTNQTATTPSGNGTETENGTGTGEGTGTTNGTGAGTGAGAGTGTTNGTGAGTGAGEGTGTTNGTGAGTGAGEGTGTTNGTGAETGTGAGAGTGTTNGTGAGTGTGAGGGTGTTNATGAGAERSLGTAVKRSLRSFNNGMKTVDKNILSLDESINDLDFQSKLSSLQKMVRRKRQTQSSIDGMYGLPTSFAVTLPQSCCTTALSATDNLQNLYCLSNANGGSNNFHTDGCSQGLGKLAIGQSLGISVINSFLIILALAAIPLFLSLTSNDTFPQSGYNNDLMTQNQQQYGGGYNPNAARNNFGPAPQTYA